METKLHKRSSDAKALPLEEQIRLRAYELYIQRGNESGSESDDWLQAEEELVAAREWAAERD